MPVHPQIAEFLSTLPPSDATPPDPAVRRAAGESHVPPLEERLPLHAVEDLVADTVVGPVPVRIYTPIDADTYGVLVYFHGGAFFSGSLETHDGIARALAKASGFKVISVGYRLAPEAAFPAGLDDCYGALRWAIEHGSKLGWDGHRLAVAGDSSGGNFAAVIAARAHDEGLAGVSHQVLLYPSVDLDFDLERYPSLRANAIGYGLETVALAPHNSFYLSSGATPDDPRVSPIKRAELSGFAPALIITAEYDPLRDEGEQYGERLAEAGVNVTVHRYAGATHGFVQHFGWLPEYQKVFAEIAEFLNQPL